MAAETIPIDVLPALQLIAHQRPSQATDNWKRAGESGAGTSETYTFVYTKGATPADSTLTCDAVHA